MKKKGRDEEKREKKQRREVAWLGKKRRWIRTKEREEEREREVKGGKEEKVVRVGGHTGWHQA